jgi:polyphosphate kinase
MKFEYINKDISWLSFNKRVLDEAADGSLSLYERLRFVAIYSNNLDEFYHFKVFPYIRKASHIAPQIREIVLRQQDYYISLFNKLVFEQTCSDSLHFIKSFTDEQLVFVSSYFKKELLNKLQLFEFSSLDDFLLKDNFIYFIIKYKKFDSLNEEFAFIEFPKNIFESFISIQDNEIAFVEDIIKANIHILFPLCTIEGVYSFKVIRHLNIKARGEGSSIDLVTKGLEHRKTAGVSALFYDEDMPEDCMSVLANNIELSRDVFIKSSSYLRFSDLLSSFKVRNPTPHCKHSFIEEHSSVIKAVEKKDLLLHFPYHSFDYFIQLLRETIEDKSVCRISITWYRVSVNTLLVDILIAAVANNIEVVVVMELKAKMEEEKNIAFAKKMSAAGIKILYTNIEMKVHCKMMLINRKENADISYLSTGNFNEQTAKIYTDHAFISTSSEITKEVNVLFKEIREGDINYPFKKLFISPLNLRVSLSAKIQREILHARAGRDASLIFKMNGLQDRRMIDLLYEASLAGVKIKLMVRGMCRILTDKPFSKNISLYRLVDKYLEHGRIYYFQNDGDTELFMGSADLMTKKLDKRVELVFPIEDEELKLETKGMLDILFSDNQKLSLHVIDRACGFTSFNTEPIRAQEDLFKYLSSEY